MGQIEGEKTVEIDAPVERCFEIAADIENAPDWQGSLQDVDVLERDGDGRAELVETKSDAKVKSVRALLRFSYTRADRDRAGCRRRATPSRSRAGGRSRTSATGRTRASYGLAADPGRMLGMLLRGPAETKVRDFLLGGAAEGLKRKAEGYRPQPTRHRYPLDRVARPTNRVRCSSQPRGTDDEGRGTPRARGIDRSRCTMAVLPATRWAARRTSRRSTA